MDNEPLETPTNSSTNTTEPYHSRQNFYKRLFLELFTLVAVMSVIASILLIFAILKYKKVRRNVTNKILLHLSILQLVYLFATPVTHRLIGDFDIYQFPFLVNLLCILNEIEAAVYLSVMFTVILLLCDWYLKVYGSAEKYRKFGNVVKFFVVMIYVIAISTASVTSQFCLHDDYIHLTIIANFLLYIFVVIVVIITNVVHKVKSRSRTISLNNNSVGLAVSNIVVFSWFPALITLIIAMFGVGYPTALIIFTCLGFSSPIFILFYLFYYDNDFNVFLGRIFKCKCNVYENEDFESSSVVYNGRNEVYLS